MAAFEKWMFVPSWNWAISAFPRDHVTGDLPKKRVLMCFKSNSICPLKVLVQSQETGEPTGFPCGNLREPQHSLQWFLWDAQFFTREDVKQKLKGWNSLFKFNCIVCETLCVLPERLSRPIHPLSMAALPADA